MTRNSDDEGGHDGPGLRDEALTRQERVVLAYLTTGATDRQIAAAMTIGITTVKTHEQHIYGKLGAHNRTEAAFLARKLGEGPDDPPAR